MSWNDATRQYRTVQQLQVKGSVPDPLDFFYHIQILEFVFSDFADPVSCPDPDPNHFSAIVNKHNITVDEKFSSCQIKSTGDQRQSSQYQFDNNGTENGYLDPEPDPLKQICNKLYNESGSVQHKINGSEGIRIWNTAYEQPAGRNLIAGMTQLLPSLC